ncbi:MAG: hypothetical protein PVF68_05545 [Acidobacteriota bacterium]|jgi:hypothetical protein
MVRRTFRKRAARKHPRSEELLASVQRWTTAEARSKAEGALSREERDADALREFGLLDDGGKRES